MITLFVLPLILAFAPIALWALSVGGLRRLWLVCALALLALVVVAFMLSAIYSVPSSWRVLYYSLALVGPSLVFATGSLAVANTFARSLPVHLIATFAGSLIGLAVGLVVVVYVLGVW
jgi:di/tricarboxylate transporter